jgi:hypothetical protein
MMRGCNNALSLAPSAKSSERLTHFGKKKPFRGGACSDRPTLIGDGFP